VGFAAGKLNPVIRSEKVKLLAERCNVKVGQNRKASINVKMANRENIEVLFSATIMTRRLGWFRALTKLGPTTRQ
jgi:hypothetical protein